jgi:transposase-like protein
MDWPRTPVERLQDFRPPFCPRKNCTHHIQPNGFRFRWHGSYPTARGVRVRRFRCLHCRSTFSRRSFSVTYYLKRPELLRPVAAGLQAGSGHRQLARTLGCAPSTVTRLSARLGRHALLLQCRALAALEGQLGEPIVLDHFETFEFTQDLPLGVATAVGARSWFVYALDPAPHARTGRRSPTQERRRKRRARRPRRGGYLGSATRTLDRVLPLCPPDHPLHLVSDGHPAYDRAVEEHPRSEAIRLERHPNPPRRPKGSPRSARAIARDRAMFPVDLLHGLLRHSLAAHKRETIAFGRRLNAIVERLFLTAIWRNFVKGVSERRNDRTTPAMRLGLTDRPWKWERVLGRRLFPDRERLDGVWLELYRRDWTTPELVSNTRHRPVFTY